MFCPFRFNAGLDICQGGFPFTQLHVWGGFVLFSSLSSIVHDNIDSWHTGLSTVTN